MADSVEQKAEQVKSVDETPISPTSANHSRKDSLQNHLLHRPDRSELIEKNILPKSTAAPGLIAHQRELQKHMLEDKLNDKISHRPAPEELIKGNILHDDPRTAEQKYEEAIADELAKREGGA